VARNRQRAKQRQAARRASRVEGAERPTDDRLGPDASAGNGREAAASDADLATGAPPPATGRSDTLFGSHPAEEPEGIPDADELDDEAAEELEREAESEALEVPLDPSHPDRGGHVQEPGPPGRSRLVTFLVGCWTELKRVQWPGRSQLFTLTGVVLGFVVIAGGYLGLLDFVFNRLIRALLISTG